MPGRTQARAYLESLDGSKISKLETRDTKHKHKKRHFIERDADLRNKIEITRKRPGSMK